MKNTMLISLILTSLCVTLTSLCCYQLSTIHELGLRINEFKLEQAALKTDIANTSAELENIETQLHIDRESVQD